MDYPVLSIEELSRALWEQQQKQAIEELMADYWWYMDSRQWDKWTDVFTEDLEVWFDDMLTVEGRDAFVELNSTVWLGKLRSAHQGHQHKIELTSPTTASGRFILNDMITDPDNLSILHGYGYYIDDYRLCDDGKWRIAVVRLGYFLKGRFNIGSEDTTELHEEIELEEGVPLV